MTNPHRERDPGRPPRDARMARADDDLRREPDRGGVGKPLPARGAVVTDQADGRRVARSRSIPGVPRAAQRRRADPAARSPARGAVHIILLTQLQVVDRAQRSRRNGDPAPRSEPAAQRRRCSQREADISPHWPARLSVSRVGPRARREVPRIRHPRDRPRWKPEIVYVGQSSANRLYDTLTRHFPTAQVWRGQFGEGPDPGLTYSPRSCGRRHAHHTGRASDRRGSAP